MTCVGVVFASLLLRPVRIVNCVGFAACPPPPTTHINHTMLIRTHIFSSTLFWQVWNIGLNSSGAAALFDIDALPADCAKQQHRSVEGGIPGFEDRFNHVITDAESRIHDHAGQDSWTWMSCISATRRCWFRNDQKTTLLDDGALSPPTARIPPPHSGGNSNRPAPGCRRSTGGNSRRPVPRHRRLVAGRRRRFGARFR